MQGGVSAKNISDFCLFVDVVLFALMIRVAYRYEL